MFDIALGLMTDFIPLIPPMVAIILFFNIISDLLFRS